MQRINLAVEVMGVSWGEGGRGKGGRGEGGRGGVKKLKYKGRRKERKIW